MRSASSRDEEAWQATRNNPVRQSPGSHRGSVTMPEVHMSSTSTIGAASFAARRGLPGSGAQSQCS
jgi:hypothetical protein